MDVDSTDNVRTEIVDVIPNT